MKKIVFITFLLSFFLINPALAQKVTQAQVKQQISQAASKLKSMQCDFVQTKHLKMLNDKVVSKGKMYYQQSDKLRWEYVSPYKYTFILNGSKVQLKNSKRNDVIDVEKNKLFKEIARIMMSSVVGNCMNDKSFKVTISDEKSLSERYNIPVLGAVPDFFIDDPESFRIFGSDNDPSGIAVNTVAESRSEGVFLTGMPLAFLSKVSLNVSNKSIIVPLTCTVTKHTRFFICQKDILILIDDGYTGFTYFQIGVFFSRLFKEFIVNVELYTISL